jgi:hypothetical protein
MPIKSAFTTPNDVHDNWTSEWFNKDNRDKILRHNNGVSPFFKTGGRQAHLSQCLQDAMAEHTAKNITQL